MRRVGCILPRIEAIDENVAHAMGAQPLDGPVFGAHNLLGACPHGI